MLATPLLSPIDPRLTLGSLIGEDGAMATVLLVEDDPRIRSAIALALEREGYATVGAVSGEEGIAKIGKVPIDIALVDLTLPGMDGLQACAEIRAISSIPIIIVTARQESDDVVAGLEAGADDYVTKPFVVKELAARIRALLRRAVSSAPDRHHLGELTLIPAEGALRHADGSEVHCTFTEFRLLSELVAHRGEVLSREHLLEHVWGYDYFGDSRIVDVHIRRLRTKVEPDAANPELIITVRGMGYKLEGP